MAKFCQILAWFQKNLNLWLKDITFEQHQFVRCMITYCHQKRCDYNILKNQVHSFFSFWVVVGYMASQSFRKTLYKWKCHTKQGRSRNIKKIKIISSFLINSKWNNFYHIQLAREIDLWVNLNDGLSMFCFTCKEMHAQEKITPVKMACAGWPSVTGS